MAGIKEIRNKIKSIKSTQKITHAMEMVAASKMRKTQSRMRASRPYARRLRDVIANLVRGTLEYTHPYMLTRTVKRAGFIVMSTDRGLCGGLNFNLFKTVIREMQALNNAGVEIEVCTFGAKAEQFFKRVGGNVVASVVHVGDSPQVDDIIGPVKILLDSYVARTIDAVFLVYNEFINTMSQSAKVEQLLPIIALQSAAGTVKSVITGSGEHKVKDWKHWDYIYEPSAEILLHGLLLRYIESSVYQAMVENVASEQAARMVAMQSATTNAGELINEFQLLYNKARQAAITRELSEIVSGAQAV